jgi:hypothetical protein
MEPGGQWHAAEGVFPDLSHERRLAWTSQPDRIHCYVWLDMPGKVRSVGEHELEFTHELPSTED